MKNNDIKHHRGNLLSDIIRLIKNRKAVRSQTTFCYCPICKEELCSNNSFKSDTDLIRYECSNCGCRSAWDFDTFPPSLINADKIIYDRDI